MGHDTTRAQPGRLFVDVHHRLEAIPYELIEREAARVVLDFEAVDFMDAAGLRALLGARRTGDERLLRTRS